MGKVLEPVVQDDILWLRGQDTTDVSAISLDTGYPHCPHRGLQIVRGKDFIRRLVASVFGALARVGRDS